MITRRGFVAHTCGLGIASATISSTALSLGLSRSVAAAEVDGYKALVCILLAGGNDSFNMLVPTDDDQYAEYTKIRSNLSLDRATLLGLPAATSTDRNFGLHPGIPEIHEMYGNGELAFVANIGTLMEPVDAQAIRAGSATVPVGLYSHSDQIAQWQTAISYNRASTYGWGGRMADLIEPDPMNGLSMNISLSGSNLFQSGTRVSPYSIYSGGDGANTVWSYPHVWENGINIHREVRRILDVDHDNILRREYARRLRGAMNNYDTFVNAIRSGPDFATPFSNHYFSRALRQISRVIAARDTFGQSRQTFFVRVGGWDHHDGLVDRQNQMLPWVSRGLYEFRNALMEIGAFNDVTTFTISDFARTLTSNGKGSDHAWGGHQMVMGGSVRGGDMYGTYPLLSESSPLYIGRGVYIPTTSVEEYFSELALWFGAPRGSLDEILPNVRRFYSPESSSAPLGILV